MARLTKRSAKPEGFILPAQPKLYDQPPQGGKWIHEIKHDGYRIVAVREGAKVRLWSRSGQDWAQDLHGVREAILALPVDTVVIDGEAIAHTPEGLPNFHGLQSKRGQAEARLYAFDLLRLDDLDLRKRPLFERKTGLEALIQGYAGLTYVEHLQAEGQVVYEHACKLGLEGIISKLADSLYRSGPTDYWRKIKNPAYRRK